MGELLTAQSFIPVHDDPSGSWRPENSFDEPVRKLARTMSRPLILLTKIAFDQREKLKPVIDRAPERTGIYCALANGPIDAECVKRLKAAPEEKWPGIFKDHCPPKQHLKTYVSIGAAHLSILLGTRGPVVTFYHPRFAVKHAIQAASADLREHRIDLALVASAADEPNEGAALIALAKPYEPELSDAAGEFGIASPLIALVKKGNDTQ